MVAKDKVINWVEEVEPNNEDVQVVPQVVVTESAKEQGALGLGVEQASDQEIQK